MKRLCLIIILLIPAAAYSQVTIKGTVINARDSVILFKEPGGFTNNTRSWRDRKYKARIDEHNRFSIVLPENEINTWLIETPKGYQFFDLISGNNIDVIADFSKTAPLTAINENADDFNYTAYAAESDPRDAVYWKAVSNKRADSALLLRKQKAAERTGLLDQYRETHKMSDLYYKWLRSKYRYEPYERTLVENVDRSDTLHPALPKQLFEQGFDDEFAALHTLEYNDVVDAYINEAFARTGKPFTPQTYFGYITHTLKNSTRDIQLTRLMAWLKKADDSVYLPVYKKYITTVQNKNLIKEVDALRQEFTQPPAAMPMDTLTSLTQIFNKYKGKVLYIDFWASWCVPCRGDFPVAERLKEKLAGKDIVFLYLGGYHDLERNWKKAREELDIAGEHYFLNERLMKQAEEAFHINSVPHYVIMDKKGNLIDRHAARPDDVYEQLNKLLKD
ncbi:TlpA family protein disulfide reductase [Niabella aurantiaca]|uniref:TlpA family protein disulfide reductase n=1 Tax=Niabella aurantiaca TaxID=379900 RepID=UPI0003708BB5|nr:TlpA disulfide reductase family protein [Niabella aurantiaca]